ncbi:MAG: hypothetical protein JKY65_24445 [Planctomycetes bacterium]|nr:hypothetical protein [Planctomycetota bacterium]
MNDGLASLLRPLVVLAAPLWVLLLRYGFADLSAINGVAPDVALIAAVAAAWTRKPLGAVAFAALLGASLDLASTTPWGLGAVRYATLAALVCGVRRVGDFDLPGISVVLVLAFACAERGLAALTIGVRLQLPLTPLLLQAGGIALLSALLAPLGFATARALAPATTIDEAWGRR